MHKQPPRQSRNPSRPEMIPFQQQVDQSNKLRERSENRGTNDGLSANVIMQVLEQQHSKAELAQLLRAKFEDELETRLRSATAENAKLRAEVEELKRAIERLKGKNEKTTSSPDDGFIITQ